MRHNHEKLKSKNKVYNFYKHYNFFNKKCNVFNNQQSNEMDKRTMSAKCYMKVCEELFEMLQAGQVLAWVCAYS